MRLDGFGPSGLRLPSSRLRIGPKLGLVSAVRSAVLREQQDFGPNPGGLRMFLHLPQDLPKNAPLVVMLHGCGQNAAEYDKGTGWSELADELGFAVLAPEQSHANNMGGCFNWFQPGDTARGQGEAASIQAMIACVLAQHDLDPKRVFITGLSAGGAMATALLVSYPDLFAGGAIIAGLPFGSAANVPEAMNSMRRAPERSPKQWGDAVRQASAHKGPWPIVSVWHGDADSTVHVSNGDALVAQWADLHGAAPAESEEGRRLWRRADGEVVVEAFTIAGMGHGTPIGGPEAYGNAGPFFLDVGLSSTARIAAFWGLDKTPLAQTRKPRRKKPVVVPPAAAKPNLLLPPELLVLRPEPEHGVKAVIVKALKAAGLLKD